jgi:hypothetical protein
LQQDLLDVEGVEGSGLAATFCFFAQRIHVPLSGTKRSYEHEVSFGYRNLAVCQRSDPGEHGQRV